MPLNIWDYKARDKLFGLKTYFRWAMVEHTSLADETSMQKNFFTEISTEYQPCF